MNRSEVRVANEKLIRLQDIRRIRNIQPTCHYISFSGTIFSDLEVSPQQVGALLDQETSEIEAWLKARGIE